eukprot:jgi/Mesvir1/26523/Mv16179-RA.1
MKDGRARRIEEQRVKATHPRVRCSAPKQRPRSGLPSSGVPGPRKPIQEKREGPITKVWNFLRSLGEFDEDENAVAPPPTDPRYKPDDGEDWDEFEPLDKSMEGAGDRWWLPPVAPSDIENFAEDIEEALHPHHKSTQIDPVLNESPWQRLWRAVQTGEKPDQYSLPERSMAVNPTRLGKEESDGMTMLEMIETMPRLAPMSERVKSYDAGTMPKREPLPFLPFFFKQGRSFPPLDPEAFRFLGLLVAVPISVIYIMNHLILFPILERYAATHEDFFEPTGEQKVEMYQEIKFEKHRLEFEAMIKKAPPLDEQETHMHLRKIAIKLKEEMVVHNMHGITNLMSEISGVIVAVLMWKSSPRRVRLLCRTALNLFHRTTSTTKALWIILVSDVLIGYHSDEGWRVVTASLFDHWGFDINETAMVFIVGLVPVYMDASFKYWMFTYLTRISPTTSTTLKYMNRH